MSISKSAKAIESEILQKAMPHIQKLCNNKWTNMEPEDRIAEATCFFLYALRSLPINTGHFFKDYEKALIPYMNQKNRLYPSRFHGDFSLDCPIPTPNGNHDWNRYDVEPGPSFDESKIDVDMFLDSLSSSRQDIITDLIAGLAKSTIAQKNNISLYQLKKTLIEIGNIYQNDEWFSNQRKCV